MPTRVSTTQKTTTMRLWARTQRVSDAMCVPSYFLVSMVLLGLDGAVLQNSSVS